VADEARYGCMSRPWTPKPTEPVDVIYSPTVQAHYTEAARVQSPVRVHIRGISRCDRQRDREAGSQAREGLGSPRSPAIFRGTEGLWQRRSIATERRKNLFGMQGKMLNRYIDDIAKDVSRSLSPAWNHCRRPARRIPGATFIVPIPNHDLTFEYSAIRIGSL
jgi:hypothetical protein